MQDGPGSTDEHDADAPSRDRMATRSSEASSTRRTLSDLRGIARLATLAMQGVARVAEGVHRSVWSTLGFPGGDRPGRTSGITGVAYRGVEGVIHGVGEGLDAALAGLERRCEPGARDARDTHARDAWLAALNGVIGDRLVADDNPLAIPMTLRHRGRILDGDAPPVVPGATAKVLLLIHGLCRNDRQWRVRHDGGVVDHGEALASALGYTPVHLRYNSGLHVARNGRELSERLERLTAHWPVPIEDLTVVAFSMGGLVIRSAFHHGRQEARGWPDRVRNIVFLGTPHHGAPLERAGHRVDTILGGMPYTAPFAEIGRLRSAGITDLRHGRIVGEGGPGCDRSARVPDDRRFVPLPEGVACYAVAATTASARGILADRVIGDGLVPVRSALGRHDDPRRTLAFPDTAQRVVYRTDHIGLLGSPEVTRQLVRWLTPGGVGRRPGDGERATMAATPLDPGRRTDAGR